MPQESVVSMTVNHGVALLIGFIMAIILEKVTTDQFASDSILTLIADNIVVIYLVLVIAVFAYRMSDGVGGNGGAPRGL